MQGAVLKLKSNVLCKILQQNLIETIWRPFRSCPSSANDVDVRESSVGGGDDDEERGGRGGADDDEGNGGSSGNDDGDGHIDRPRRGC